RMRCRGPLRDEERTRAKSGSRFRGRKEARARRERRTEIMNAENNPNRPPSRCGCRCHQKKVAVKCCPCYAKGEGDCGCGERKRCCGEAERPNRPDSPKPPGWEPGDKPPKDPFGGAAESEAQRGKFTQAVLDIIR